MLIAIKKYKFYIIKTEFCGFIMELKKLRGCSVANRLHFIICSIRAPFSVAHFVISGGYYCGSFEYVIESIVQLRLYNEAPD